MFTESHDRSDAAKLQTSTNYDGVTPAERRPRQPSRSPDSSPCALPQRRPELRTHPHLLAVLELNAPESVIRHTCDVCADLLRLDVFVDQMPIKKRTIAFKLHQYDDQRALGAFRRHSGIGFRLHCEPLPGAVDQVIDLPRRGPGEPAGQATDVRSTGVMKRTQAHTSIGGRSPEPTRHRAN